MTDSNEIARTHPAAATAQAPDRYVPGNAVVHAFRALVVVATVVLLAKAGASVGVTDDGPTAARAAPSADLVAAADAPTP